MLSGLSKGGHPKGDCVGGISGRAVQLCGALANVGEAGVAVAAEWVENAGVDVVVLLTGEREKSQHGI